MYKPFVMINSIKRILRIIKWKKHHNSYFRKTMLRYKKGDFIRTTRSVAWSNGLEDRANHYCGYLIGFSFKDKVICLDVINCIKFDTMFGYSKYIKTLKISIKDVYANNSLEKRLNKKISIDYTEPLDWP